MEIFWFINGFIFRSIGLFLLVCLLVDMGISLVFKLMEVKKNDSGRD